MKAFVRAKPLLAGAICASLTAFLFAEPAWWSQRGVKAPDKAASDYAAINQGQLKNLARAARDEMEANLIGGAGEAVNNLVNGWQGAVTAKDFAVVNLGQLKNTTLVFYTRLREAGMITHLPWTTEHSDDADFSSANAGQAKNLFSFDVAADADGDGIPDMWELAQFGTLNRSADLDSDGDGVFDLEEYAAGTNPFAWDSNRDGFRDAPGVVAGNSIIAEAGLHLFENLK